MAAEKRKSTVTRRQKQTMQTNDAIPAFPNVFPYNELLLNGHLDMGGFSVKSRSWEWKHRGPVVLYTSGRIERSVAEAYDLDPTNYPRKQIVGAAELVDIRPLTTDEKKFLVLKFNNVSWEMVRKYVHINKSHCFVDHLAPMPIILPFHLGFFFKNVTRFKWPVPFAWPSGPVRSYNVPVSLVAKELRQAGIRL